MWHAHCDDLVVNWKQQAVGKSGGGRRAHDLVFLDIGGNIGMCSITMLVHTDARLIVVEPSPANLFYLTSTIHKLAAQRPDIVDRVQVLPFAASNESGSDTLYVAAHNAGNSVVRSSSTAVRDHNAQNMTAEQYTIHASPLDSIPTVTQLLGTTTRFPVVKLDVQGFECRAIDGMGQLLQQAQVLRVELADRWLRAQGCSSLEALKKLQSLGFAVDLRRPPSCIFSRYGCDVTVMFSKEECTWQRHNVTMRCAVSSHPRQLVQGARKAQVAKLHRAQAAR